MKNIYQVLEDLGIKFIERKHEAFFTCEEADEFYRDVAGGHSKNLLLKNKKGDQHYLVVIESSKRADLKGLAKELGESKLSFASPERLLRILGLTPGSVSPFGLINDAEGEVKVIIDKGLLKHEKLHYHPNINTATLEISRDDFLKFLNSCTNGFNLINF